MKDSDLIDDDELDRYGLGELRCLPEPLPPFEGVWRGPDDLRRNLVPIGDLHEDPANVNVHDEESVKRIAGSYARYGQQKAVVSDGNRVIRAGSGQLLAARQLGWTHLAVVVSDLTGADLAAYALADNRTAQFSRLDDLKVAELCRSLQSEPEFPIESTGYTAAEVDDLLGRLAAEQAGDEGSGDGDSAEFGDSDGRGKAIDYLKWGRNAVPMTAEEVEAIDAALKTYQDEEGTSFGFVRNLLDV